MRRVTLFVNGSPRNGKVSGDPAGGHSLSARGGDGGGRAGEALGRPSRGPRGRLWCYCRRSGGVPGGKERLLACLRGGIATGENFLLEFKSPWLLSSIGAPG